MGIELYSFTDFSAAVQAPRAVLLTIHGSVQHAGAFRSLAQQLAPSAIAVYALDLRGHGLWLQKNKNSAVDYVMSTNDVVQASFELKSKHAGVPLFCLGESVGAAVAVRALHNESELFSGLVLASFGRPQIINGDWTALGKSISDTIFSLGRSINLRAHVRHISDDDRASCEMIDDANNRLHGSLSDLWHTAMFVLNTRAIVTSLPTQLPVLVLQGGADRICCPQSVQPLFESIGSRDKTLKVFPHCGHLLVTGSYLKEALVHTLVTWILARS